MKKLPVFLIALSLLLSLAACGLSGTATTPTPAPTPTITPEPAATPAPTPEPTPPFSLPVLEEGIALEKDPERRYIYFDGMFGGYWDGDWHSVCETGIRPYDLGVYQEIIPLDKLLEQEGFVLYHNNEILGTTRSLFFSDSPYGLGGMYLVKDWEGIDENSMEYYNEEMRLISALASEYATAYGDPEYVDIITYGLKMPMVLEGELKGLFYDNPYNGSFWLEATVPEGEPWRPISAAVNAPVDISCPTLETLGAADIPQAAVQWMFDQYDDMSDITEVMRADLDSDGELEYLVVIDTAAEVDGVPVTSRYSYFMVLMVDGDEVTPLIENRTGPFGTSDNPGAWDIGRYQTPSIVGVYDFNSDGIFEVCVRFQFWEWSSHHVFSDGVEVLRAQSGM